MGEGYHNQRTKHTTKTKKEEHKGTTKARDNNAQAEACSKNIRGLTKPKQNKEQKQETGRLSDLTPQPYSLADRRVWWRDNSADLPPAGVQNTQTRNLNLRRGEHIPIPTERRKGRERASPTGRFRTRSRNATPPGGKGTY